MATPKKSNKKSTVVSSNDQVWMEINRSLTKYIPVDKQEEVEDNVVLNEQEKEMSEEVNEFELKVREIVEQSSWEQVYLKLTTQSTTSLAKSGSKMEKCVDIYQSMIDQPNTRRIDIINAFVSQEGISKEHASTYFQTIKTRLKKSTGQ